MLTVFMNHLASGLLPQEVQPFLAGAYPIGLSKRWWNQPNYCWGCVQMTNIKCVPSSILSNAKIYFLPTQCVYAPGGGVAVVQAHVWRKIMDAFQNNHDFIGLKIDFINACNLVARSIFVIECFEKFLKISKWIHFCYSKYSHTFFKFYHFISSRS